MQNLRKKLMDDGGYSPSDFIVVDNQDDDNRILIDVNRIQDVLTVLKTLPQVGYTGDENLIEFTIVDGNSYMTIPAFDLD